MTRRPKKFILRVAHDPAEGIYYCLDERRPLYMTEAKSLNALRAQLLPLVRADFAGDDTELVLQVVKDEGPRAA